MSDPNPYPHEHAPHKTQEEARQGSTPGVTRYVLGISLALVVVAFIVAYVILT